MNDDLGYCESCGRTREDLTVWVDTTHADRRRRILLAKERLDVARANNSTA